ncbi:MAG: hypothetical protein WD772_10045, partial [Pseudohongiellaceae bacterium]
SVFLQLISWNFVAQAIVFSSSGIFQGLGNTRPALLSSLSRLVFFVVISLYLKSRPDYAINQVWYVSIASVTLQAVVSFMLVRIEFSKRLSKPQLAA